MKPGNNRIIITPILSTGKPSVIITPEIAKRLPTEGVIVSLGEFRTPMGELFDPGLSVGNRVAFLAAGPSHIKIDGKDLLVVDYGDILVNFDGK